MRIILVGSPESGKRALAQSIVDNVPDLTLQLPTGYTTPNMAIGYMADYRMELHIAIDRMWESRLRDKCVYTTSLLDSVAYSSYKLFLIGDEDASSVDMVNRWLWTANLIAAILTDSFQYDLIVRVPGYKDETGREIGKLLDATIDLFDFPVIKGSGDLEADTKEVKEWIETNSLKT